MTNPQTALQTGLNVPNSKKHVDVSADDLPLHCPLPGSSLWNSHPRVYIAFDEQGRGKCPYCGTDFHLLD